MHVQFVNYRLVEGASQLPKKLSLLLYHPHHHITTVYLQVCE